MRRVIAFVIIGLVMAIAILFLQKQRAARLQTERHAPVNYYEHLRDCGAACVPLAAVLVVVTE